MIKQTAFDLPFLNPVVGHHPQITFAEVEQSLLSLEKLLKSVKIHSALRHNRWQLPVACLFEV